MFARGASKELEAQYESTGKVRFIFRQFPFLGQESFWAAEAAECAGDQGRFWEFHDLLFANQSGENAGAFSKDRLKGFAATLGLDLPTFYSCLDAEKTLPRVQDDIKSGEQFNVYSTPTIVILGRVVDPSKPIYEPPNGRVIRGAPSFASLRTIVDQELAK